MTVGDSLSDEILELVHRWWRSWSDKDLETIQRMAAAEYTELTDTRHFRRLGGAALMEEARQFCESARITEWKLWKPAVRCFRDTAIVNYHFAVSGVVRGKAFHFEGYATDVLLNQEGSWRYASHQGTLTGDWPDRPFSHQ